jgi:GH15 family glucan-1,4-alpha-glucosidase
MTGRIEDYAMIGNCRSAALVGRDGSIDWLCAPRFDSAACFAALLGTPEHGRWLLAPAGEARAERRYRDGGLVLETLWRGAGGAARVIDFMPVDGDTVGIVRIVEGLRGRLDLRSELVVRFDYGCTVPWVSRHDDGTLTAVAGPDLLALRAGVESHGEGRSTVAEFTVGEGERVAFALTYGASHLPLPPPLDAQAALAATEAFWNDWSSRCAGAGEWSAMVKRSLVTLKGLSYLPTGGIVAAPTTSLPECVGGTRNWDYRYCWTRDATYTLSALVNAGYHEEARAWRDWVRRAIAGTPEQLQVLYGLAGERSLEERELPWLPGYEGSRPVRVGNAASMQFQLDIFGELVGAFDHEIENGTHFVGAASDLQVLFLGHLEQVWQEPDEGIWEIRGEPRHFVHSKIMAWLAFRRAADAQMPAALAAHQARWSALADRIHAEVCAKGVDPEGGYFVQSYGSPAVDASLLLAVLVGFLPPQDERIVRTVQAVERRLLVDGLVNRYDTGTGVDGLPAGEGSFLACSFWLAENYVMLGRLDEARALFERLAALCNDVGLLAEEYDPRSGRMLGNFPQAFSHVALVNTAFRLARAAGQAGGRDLHSAAAEADRRPATA